MKGRVYMVDKVKKEIVIDKKKSDIVGIVVWLVSTAITFTIQKLIHGMVFIYPNYLMPLIVFLPIILHEPLHHLGFILNGVNSKDLTIKRYKGLLPNVRPKGSIEAGAYIRALLLPNVVIPLTFLVMVIVSDSIIYSLTLGLAICMTVIDFFAIQGLKSFEKGYKVGCLEDKFGFYIE